MQSLYVIGPKSGPFKIGITNDIKRRLSGLQTGNAAELLVHNVFNAEDAKRVESSVHAALSSARVNGEWFDCDLQRIIDTVVQIQSKCLPESDQSFWVSAETFTRWLADMKSAGLARSDAECGRCLASLLTPSFA